MPKLAFFDMSESTSIEQLKAKQNSAFFCFFGLALKIVSGFFGFTVLETSHMAGANWITSD
jgi:hypothetical protein